MFAFLIPLIWHYYFFQFELKIAVNAALTKKTVHDTDFSQLVNLCPVKKFSLFLTPDQVSDLWQQLELASELESDPQDTVDWGKKWLVDFNAGKIQLVSFDQSNNTGCVDVKMVGSVIEEKSSFKIGCITLSLLLKLFPRKVEP